MKELQLESQNLTEPFVNSLFILDDQGLFIDIADSSGGQSTIQLNLLQVEELKQFLNL